MAETLAQENRTRGGMFFRCHGSRQPKAGLVLCHGLASNSTRWNELAGQLELPPDWCLLCPDLRGHGHSTWRGRLHSRSWMRDLIDMLDQAGLKQAVIGGHCMGANLALRFAHSHPARCQGLVLIEPMLPQARVGKMKLKTLLRWLLPLLIFVPRLLNSFGIRRYQMPVLDLEKLDSQTRQLMSEQGGSQAMTKRYAAPWSDLKYIPVAAYLQSLLETLRRLPPMKRVGAPALAMISSGGMFGDPELTRQALAQIPDCRIESLEAEHWIPTEQPESMRKLLSEWVFTRFC
jgi:pimeloyl-ACP methyl ester carboxylesterase